MSKEAIEIEEKTEKKYITISSWDSLSGCQLIEFRVKGQDVDSIYGLISGPPTNWDSDEYLKPGENNKGYTTYKLINTTSIHEVWAFDQERIEKRSKKGEFYEFRSISCREELRQILEEISNDRKIFCYHDKSQSIEVITNLINDII